MTPALTDAVLDEVYAERERQWLLWGDQTHLPNVALRNQEAQDTANEILADVRKEFEWAVKYGALTWQHILQEEFFEVTAETDPIRRRAELIQLAAVAVAEVEAIDRRDKADRYEAAQLDKLDAIKNGDGEA